MEHRHCPACESNKAKMIGGKNGFKMAACGECKTLFTATLPAPSSAEDYDSYYTAENLAVPDFINARLDQIIGSFDAHRSNNRLLDVGFGAASLLQAAQRAGWGAYGVEVSATATAHARKLGLRVRNAELSAAAYPSSYFDVVTASEILEHVTEPLSMLSEIARILRPGGLLWLTTPHGMGVSSRLLGPSWSVCAPPEHLQLLSRSGMRRLLKAAGFSYFTMRTESLNPYELLSYFRRSAAPTDRVQSGYELNASMSGSPSKVIIKSAVNRLLNTSGMGDSLKVRAVR